MNRYRAFGLSIASEMVIPELVVDSGFSGQADVLIREGMGDFSPNPAYPEGSPDPTQPRLRFQLSVSDVADFLMEDGARIIFRKVDPDVDDRIVRLFLLGSCLGCVLQQLGRVVLHGNAVTMDGKTCRIVVGHSGAGKSTSAALAYREGERILADDVCAITFDDEGMPWVHPAYPQIKLWKASADLLGIPVQGLRRVHPNEEKYALPVRDRFWPTPLPLAEVIELSPDQSEETLTRGFDKARCLAEHSYRTGFLADMGLETEYMMKLMRLAGRVKVRRGVRAVITGAGSSAEQVEEE